MKISNKIKKITGSLIVLSVIVMPFADVKKVSAQTSVNFGAVNSGSNYGSGDSTSLSGYITGLAPTILQFPGCKSKISNLFGSGSSSVADLVKPESETASGSSSTHDTAGARSTLSQEESSAAAGANSVPISSDQLDTIRKNTDETLAATEKTQKSVASMDKNENCLNAIGKAVIKMLIQKMTLSIVNWIQTGNSGGPLFVQNPSKFFGDIAKNEILGFGLEINNPTKYPFAKTFMQNIATSFNNKFADNAQYSLDKMIQDTTPQYSAVSFSADFSQGGWNAWEAMTQNPANNPLGFTLMASNELQARLAGTVKSNAEITSDLLQQGNGFLGDERCTDPWGISKEQDQRFLNGETKTFIDSTTGDTMMPVKCNKWEYVTPGAVIGHTLTKSMDDNSNSLLDAQTLNDAIAAILDATVARFSSELTNKGLAAMSTSNDTASEQIDLGSLFPSGNSNTGTQFNFKTDWLQNHPGFDLHTDVTQALIDEQRTYIDKINSYNSALTDLIKWIRQLDYCIPGPHPGWEEETQNYVNGAGAPEAQKKVWWNRDFATFLKSFDPTGISSLIGNNADNKKAQEAAATFLNGLLYSTISTDQEMIRDGTGVNSVLNSLFNSYAEVINDIYFKGGVNRMNGIDTSLYMPGVTLEAHSEFIKIGGYEQIVAKNVEDITFKKSVITRLEGLKQKIDSGTAGDLNDPSNQAASEFARLSAYLVSGDDIANIYSLTKEAQDEKTYIKSDLLEGDFGCEKFMDNLRITNPTIYKKYVGREAYPFEIDHLYAPFGWGGPHFYGPDGVSDYYQTPGHYIKWSTAAVAHLTDISKDHYSNEGFLYGSYYYNNNTGNTGDQTPCPVEWVHDVALTATGNSNVLGDLALESPNTTCGVVLTFERNFHVY